MPSKQNSDDIGVIIWKMRDEVISYLGAKARIIGPAAEDAASFAMMSVLSDLRANGQSHDRSYLLDCMIDYAKQYAGRERRESVRGISTETPIGDGDAGELTIGMLATSRRYTPGHIEDYVDAAQIARAGDTMEQYDRSILLAMADGLTAEQAATDLGITPAEVRRERTRIISRVKEIWKCI